MRFLPKNRKSTGVITILLMLLLICSTVMINAQEQEAEEQESEAAGESVSESAEPTATLIFNKGKIELVMAQLKQQTGVNVVLDGKATGLRIDVLSQNEPVSQILQKIANSNNLKMVKEDDMNYILVDEKTYREKYLPQKVVRKTFVLKYIKAEEARKALQNVVTKGIGQIAADPRTNKLMVTDLPQVIELIKRLLDEIDVQLMTRVFYIRHADVQDIADKLKNYKSAPGTIEVDPKTHQIIVQDIFQNIKRMEMLVEVLDVGPEMRIYNLNNIGAEGKDAQQLAKAIEQVITKDADVFWQIDEKAGVLLVQDVPEVHEKIEKVLAAFDKPVKQVLIYAELIDTSFNKDFDFGINWDASEDLFSAARDGLFGDRIPTGGGDIADNLGFLDLSGEFPTFSMTGNKLIVGYLNEYFRASFSAAISKSDTKVLLQPRLIVKNHEEAKIKVGGQKPYRTTNYYTGDNRWQSSGQSSVSYGLEVNLTPSITNTGLVEMKITIENSDANFIGDIDQNPLVEKREVRAETTLTIPDGETRVLAGLLNNTDTRVREGIPYLAEIPIIGPLLFGKSSTNDSRRNILFFVTPTIIEETPYKKDYYRGKSLEEIINEGRELPEYLEGLTTPTLTAEDSESAEGEMPFDIPSLSSDKPVELPRLLGEDGDLDAQTLRQERETAIPGPSGSFSEASSEVPPLPPPPTERQEPRELPEADEKERPPGEGRPEPPAPPTEKETSY